MVPERELHGRKSSDAYWISGEVLTRALYMNHMWHETCWQKPVKDIMKKKENKAGGK